MSLARSASGPAGLTINTGIANSNNTQAPASGSLFGATPRNSDTGAPPAGLSASAIPQGQGGGGQMTSTGGLFGGGGGAATGGGGLFGNNSSGTTSTTTGGGLFGNANNNSSSTPAASTGGGLFGNTNNNTQQSTAGGAGGLFGGGATNNSTQPQQQQAGGATTGGGLFGNTTNTQQQSGTTGGGLFGASTANNNTTQQQQPAASTGGGLFGGAQTQAKPSGLFGQSQAAPAQQPTTATTTAPAVQINYDNLGPRSRFDDLAKPIQDEIALIDKGIARVIKMKDQIGEFMPQHERDIGQLGRDVKFVESKFRTVQVALNSDIQTVKALQDMTKKNIGDAQLSFKATDNLKLPAHYHQTGLFASSSNAAGAGASAGGAPSGSGSSSADAAGAHADAQDLITYFNRICDDLERYKKRLDEYRGEIERDMPGVENGLYEQIRSLRDRHAAAASNGGSGAGGAGSDSDGSAASVADQLGQILYALRDMGTAIVNQAGQIADTRERLSRLQAGILDSGVYAMGMAA